MSTQSGSFGDFGFGLERSTVTGKPQLAGEGLAGANEVLISERILTASAASISFSGIPDDYDHLRLEVLSRDDYGSATTNRFAVYFNSDTTAANYHRQFIQVFDGTVDSPEGSDAYIGVSTTATSTADSFARNTIWIRNYTTATKLRSAENAVDGYYTTDAKVVAHRNVTWEASTAAVSAITLTPENTANFVSGCVVRLIGVKSGIPAQVGGLAKIAEVVLSGSQATIDFANIPQKYDDLLIVASVQSTVAGTGAGLYFYWNGDTTSGNYHWQNISAYDGAADPSETASADIGATSGAIGLSNHFAINNIRIPRYAGGSRKFALNEYSGAHTTSQIYMGNRALYRVTAGSGALTDPITSVTLQPTSGSFATGTVVTVYGLGGAASLGSLATNYIEGLTTSYTSASALSIATGSARDATDSVDLTVSTALSVAITTSGANGLDTGAEAASTVYYLWLIGTGAGTVAGLLSLSNTAPTMPSGYTYKRLLPYIWLNDNNTDQTPFVVDDENVLTYTNNGAAALRIAPMPSPAAGDRFRVLIVDADGLTLDAQAGDTLRVSTEVSASGGTVSSTQLGASLNFLAVDANTWVATSGLGTWTVT